jgi:NAD(P)-dependent dehydrogenase (short-subunit alcohol dehydrogenase family)
VGKWSGIEPGALDGRVAVVTGANQGIGLEIARGLAAAGARVTLACRSRASGERAAERLAAETGGARVEAGELDLADLASVQRFADRFAAAHPALDILVNNAGVAGGPRRTSAEGWELHFATNHLGHFALTGRLMPALLAAPGARVVSVSSSVAAQGRIRFDDLQSERRYRFVEAYAQSKLSCLMFALELDRRAKRAGRGLRGLAVDPGIVRTGLLRDRRAEWDRGRRGAEWAVALAQRLTGQPARRGALPALYAAAEPALRGGEYIAPGGFAHKRGHPTAIEPPERALDPVVAAALWRVSSDLTGVGDRLAGLG